MKFPKQRTFRMGQVESPRKRPRKGKKLLAGNSKGKGKEFSVRESCIKKKGGK